jgi:sulfhydrogenase subunit beta (sulfur reductase)
VHTCDTHAIKLFDHIFGQGFTDQHYQAHRENTILVSIECLQPCSEHSFCRDMGTASAADGFDLHMTDIGNAYVLKIGTPRGAKLLENCYQIFTTTEPDMARLNDILHEKWENFPTGSISNAI